MVIVWWAGLAYLALGIFALVLLRPYIVWRRRRPPRPAEPGTTHQWRKIGIPG